MFVFQLYYCTSMTQLAIIVPFVECHPEDGQQQAEACTGFTTRFYILVPNYSPVVGIYMVLVLRS